MARGEKALQKIAEIIVDQFHITVRNNPENREGVMDTRYGNARQKIPIGQMRCMGSSVSF